MTTKLADQHEVDLNVKANIKDAQKNVQELISLVQTLEHEIDKVQRKANRNNQHVSVKDTSNIRGMQQQISSQAANLYGQSQQISHSANSAESGSLKVLAKEFAESLKKELTSDSIGYNPQTGGVPATKSYQDLMRPGGKGSHISENRNRNFEDYPNKIDNHLVEELREQNRKMQNDLNNKSSDIHNNQGSARRTGDRINTSLGSSKMSYERNQEYKSSFEEGRKRNYNYGKDVDKLRGLNQRRIDKYSAKIRGIDQRIASGTQSAEDINTRAILSQQLKTQQKFDERLKNMSDTIAKTTEVIDKSQETLEYGTSAKGNTKVLADRDSIRGRLQRREEAIEISAVTGIGAKAIQSTSTGVNNRLSTEGYVDPIMFSRAQQSPTGARKYDDRTIFNNLSNIGVKNGTGYGGKDMAQFAGAYTANTGDSNYQRGADAWSKFSRYSGAGTQNTLALEQALGNAGAGTNPGVLSRSIMNNIIGSGQQNQVANQVQGLASYAQYAQGTGAGLSNRGAQNFSAMQGVMAQTGSNMQGAMGAQAIQQLSQGLTNTQDPMVRTLMAQANGSERYTGLHGAYNMQVDASKATTDPGQLGKIVKAAVTRHSGDTKLAALDIQKAGVTDINQAKAFADQASNGKLSESALKKYTDSNKGAGDANKDAYDSSANGINNEKQAQQERNDTYFSEMTDGARGLSNSMFRQFPRAGAIAGMVGVDALSRAGLKAAGSITKPILNKGISLLGGSKLGKVSLSGGAHGSTIADLFKGASSGATEAGEMGARTAANSGRGLFSRMGSFFKGGATAGETASTVAKGASEASKVAEGASVASKAGSALKGAGAVGKDIAEGASTMAKGSKFLRGAGKFAGPLGAIASIADLGIAMGTTKKGSTERHKAVGGSLGGTVGSVAGGAFGSLLGPLGGIAGAAIGGWAGSKIGKWGGGLWKGKGDKDTAEKKAKTHKKTKSVLDRATTWLKGFNDALDKAMRVIEKAKDIDLDGKGGGGSGDDSDVDGSVKGSPKGEGANRWKSTIKKVAKAMNQKVTDKDIQDILSLIDNESGGDEKVPQKVWDQNMANGTPAKGLLQFVPSTFDNYKVKGHENILSGVDQLYALFNNTSWRNDINPAGGWTPHGARRHANGGIYNTATMRGANDIIGEAGMEAAVPLNVQHADAGRSMLDKISPMLGRVSLDKNQVQSMSSGNSFNPNVTVNVNVPAGADGNAVAKSVQQGVSQSLQETMNKMTSYYGMALK